MAVPKRRMSRSNTRARRSQWTASVPDLVPVIRRLGGAPAGQHGLKVVDRVGIDAVVARLITRGERV